MKTHTMMAALLLLLSSSFSLTSTALASPAQSTEKSAVVQARGIVNDVNLEAGNLNIDHEAIPALRWPQMTMDFEVTDKSLLNGLQPGQKIVFGLVKASPGVYLISHIKKAK